MSGVFLRDGAERATSNARWWMMGLADHSAMTWSLSLRMAISVPDA